MSASQRFLPSGIVLRDVELTLPGGGTCEDRLRPVPEQEGVYPEATMFCKGFPGDCNPREAVLPACGIYVRHADGVVFENVKTTLLSPDAREKFVFDDADVVVN